MSAVSLRATYNWSLYKKKIFFNLTAYIKETSSFPKPDNNPNNLYDHNEL